MKFINSIYCCFGLFVFMLLLSCGGESNKETSENTWLFNINKVLETSKSSRLKEVDAWGKWVLEVDIPTDAFENYESYVDEMNVEVSLNPEQEVLIKENGTGGGDAEFKYYNLSDDRVLVLSKYSTPESTDENLTVYKVNGDVASIDETLSEEFNVQKIIKLNDSENQLLQSISSYYNTSYQYRAQSQIIELTYIKAPLKKCEEPSAECELLKKLLSQKMALKWNGSHFVVD